MLLAKVLKYILRTYRCSKLHILCDYQEENE